MNAGELRESGRRRGSAARYRLQLPAIFHWNDGVEHTSGGFTSEVALDGAMILSRECPPVGSEVHLEVLFPSPERENEELRIGCAGKVTHLSKKSGGFAFGVRGMFQENELMGRVLLFKSSRATQLCGVSALCEKRDPHNQSGE